MARRLETFFVGGPAGNLECLLEEPEDAAPVEAALVCHPHPQYGGTMHNKVVYRLARGLRRAGCVVLRFNFRGVNLSEGEYAEGIGETEDARAAMRELCDRYPELPLVAAGFSFGSRVVLRLASEEQAVARAIALGFPVPVRDREFLYDVRIPKYFVQSTQDEFSPATEFSEFFHGVPEPKHLDWIPAADHFFKDSLDELESVIERIGRTR